MLLIGLLTCEGLRGRSSRKPGLTAQVSSLNVQREGGQQGGGGGPQAHHILEKASQQVATSVLGQPQQGKVGNSTWSALSETHEPGLTESPRQERATLRMTPTVLPALTWPLPTLGLHGPRPLPFQALMACLLSL